MNFYKFTCHLSMLLLFFYCTFPKGYSQKAPQKHSFEIAPDESFRTHLVDNMNINMETGLPAAVYNANYQLQEDTPEEMAKQYLLANVPLYGLAFSDLSDLKHHATRTTEIGHTVRFRQQHQGLPVNKAEIAITIDNNNVVTFVMNNYIPKVSLNNITVTFPKSEAVQMAKDHIRMSGRLKLEKSELMVYSNKGNARLAYKVIIMADEPLGDWQVYIDAKTKEIFKAVDAALYCNANDHDHPHDHENHAHSSNNKDKSQLSIPVNGTGNVFDPDPLSSAMTTYGTGGYTDNNDLDSPDLTSQLVPVTLLDIDLTGGIHTLKGPWAEIVDTGAPMTGLFTQASSAFNYNRGDDAFEAVNTYYHIDFSMRYMNITLNCPVEPFQYPGGVQFDPQGANNADNSFYSGSSGSLEFGEGCVDDAEDTDVIHHELGHGIHDWITSGNLSQVDGLSEGCGDYWAQSYNRGKGFWTAADPQFNWVFNWDGHNVCWAGRTTDYTAAYPAGLVGQIHTDGQIWSTCMMKVWDAVGQQQTDKIFLLGLGMTGGSASQNDAANAVYQAAISLGYPATDLTNIHSLLTGCGYTLPPLNAPPVVSFEADATAICLDDGGVVNFTDLSVGNPTSWSWTFPGATPATSTMQNPVVTYTADGIYNVTLTATNANGTDTETITGYIEVVSGANCPSCVTFTANDVPIVISNSGTPTITSTIGVPTAGSIVDVNIVNLNGTHSFVGDLTFTLTAPSGTSATLMTQQCGTNNLFDLGFDDEAATATIACPPTGGTMYIPTSPLSAFNGEDPVGNWVLTVSDGADTNGGSLNGWAIEICQFLNAACNLNLTTSVVNSTCGFATGSATVTAGAGASPFTYLWDANAGNQNTQTAMGLLPNTYLVSVTDANSCIQVINATITGPPNVINAVASQNAAASCSNTSDGALNIVATGGIPPYDYEWDFGSTVQSPFFIAPGTYVVSVTDGTGCTATTTGTVTGPPAIVSMNTSTPENCASKDGTATVNPSGGVPGYNYQWDLAAAGQVTQTATGLAAGPYLVTITDTNGCTSVETVTVLGTAGPSLTSSATLANCMMTDGTATVNPIGTAPFMYQWDANAGNQTTQTAINLGSGTYVVVVTDASGCSDQISVVVADNCAGCALTAIGSNVDETCAGFCDGMADVNPNNGTAPFNILWDAAAANQTTLTAINLCPGTYSVTVVDAQMCVSITTVSVLGPTVLGSTPTSTSTTCAGNDGSASANPTGGTGIYTYQWDAASGNQTTQTAINLSAGTYSVSISDTNGCEEILTVTVADGCACNVSATSMNTGATCAGNDGTATVNPTGGTAPYSFQWDAAAGNQITQTAINLPPATYVVNYSDATGCAGVLTVVVPDACTCALTSSTSSTGVTCAGGDGTASIVPGGGTAPYSFQWDAAAGNQTVATAINLAPGTYSVIYSDSNGCSNSTTVTVVDACNCALTSSTSSTGVTCAGGDGTASIVPGGGTAPYTFQWDAATGNQTAATAINLVPGTYGVVYSDSNGCSSSTTVVVVDACTCAISVSVSATTATCGAASGTATANPVGGAAPITYIWSNSSTTQSINGLTPGAYSVTVTDANGCPTNGTVIVNDSGVLNATITSNNLACNGDLSGAVSVTNPGAFNYIWSNSATTSSINNLPAGQYTVTVSQGSCVDVETVFLTEPPAINAAVITNDSQCSLSGASANATVNGGNPPYQYLWNTNSTMPGIGGLMTGTYTCTITDAAGCTRVISGNVVSEANGPVLSSTHTDISCSGDNDGTIDLTVNGGTAPFTYTWSNGVPLEDQAGLPAGAYTVNVTDANGCIGVTTVLISEPAQMSVTFTVTPSTGNDGSAGANVNGGVPAYIFQWDNGQTGPIATGLAPGEYTVIITDAEGCITQATVTVSVYSGVVELENLTNFELRPNPSNGVFTVDLEFLNVEKASLHIYNVLGQELYVQQLEGSEFAIPIDLSSEAGGAYFAIVRTSKGEAVKRFVITE